MTRRFVAVSVALLALVSTAALAGSPIYEVRVLKPVGDAIAGPHGRMVREALGDQGQVLDAGACTADSQFDQRPAARTYGAECRRLRVVFGPIMSKPGQDDVLIQPVTFEKPLYDGYIVRFRPNMVDALGVTPPVEEMHLHHGTWLETGAYGLGRDYGSGPWIASGEEKTIVPWPYRYGLRVEATDQWLFLHMIHNATPETFPVWVQYDIDFVAREDAEVLQPDGRPLLTNTRGIWLDVGNGSYHPQTEQYTLNPIFNIQKGFGGGGVCRFPDLNCAAFNSDGNLSAQQGKDFSPEVPGKDHVISREDLGGQTTGTLVMMGGHTHNGGLRTEVELVRNGVSKMINVSEAYYWQPAPNQDRIGAPPISWDYSQSGLTADLGWAVDVKEGDILRLNGVYDTTLGSWYEQMAIVMTWVVPGGGPEGIDVFDPAVEINPGISTLAVVPKGADGNPLSKTCAPTQTRLCLRGQVSHPHLSASGNHGVRGGQPVNWTAIPDGLHLSDVPVGGFSFGPAEQGVAVTTGVPYVDLGESISFHNADTADNMWHTITRCALPCTGATTVDYPIADGGSGNLVWVPFDPVPANPPYGQWTDPMDFDSQQLGIGLGAVQRVSWTFTPTQAGTFTFFCRVHPQMRGVYRVR
ncbi:MAG: hypothetical protein ACRDJM_03425 [Actinomycetota bacterium]